MSQVSHADQRRNQPDELLAGLFQAELQRSQDQYLAQQSQLNSIRRHVSAFERYLPYLPRAGVFLDWGCGHAPDACLLRNALGEGIELHGCDFHARDQFPTFHAFAGLKFEPLVTVGTLPYSDSSFDVVVGSGVLEHTANDSEALKELHRVLKEGGLLVLTLLPNRLSYTEFLLRRNLGKDPHARLYGRAEAIRLALHHGFQPVMTAYHQMVPAHQLQGVARHLWRLNAGLERTWPLNRLASNVMLVCRRKSVM